MNIDKEIALAVIQRIASIAQNFSFQAGVASMETAGSFVSFLAVNPDYVDGFMNGTGSFIDWPVTWHRQGCLSWYGQDNKIYTPEEARRQEVIDAMIKGEDQ